MKLLKIKIEDLFEVFTHEIPFSQESSITMILGRNGLGKTVVLKIIKAVLSGDFIQLEDIEFSKIFVDFTGNISWIFEKESVPVENSSEFEKHITISLSQEEIVIDKVDYSIISDNLEKLKKAISRYLPASFRLMDSDDWLDRRTGIHYNTSELIEKFKLDIPESVFSDFIVFPEWYSSKIKNLKVAFIETQRLLTFSKESDEFRYKDRGQVTYKNTVEEYAEDLVKQIHLQLAKSSELSTKLDRTYPNRLIQRLKKTTNVSQEDLNTSLQNLEAKRERLQSVGLLDLQNQPHIEIIDEEQDEKIRDVLQVYIEDSRGKLEVYDDLADRIDLFLQIINDRFLKKRLSISRTDGFHFVSTKNGKDIPLKSLSSGEQHILVLYYELLFKIEKGTLLLMDEPEISLHIAWQKKIINDLEEILKLNPMEVIITTHSPAVIGNNWKLTVELDSE